MDATGLTKGGAGLQELVRADLGGVRGTIAADRVGDHLVADAPVEIEVDVGQIGAARVQETLRFQAEAERIDVGDADQIADERIPRRAAQGHAMTAAAGIAGDVADDEEIARQTRRLQHGQFAAQPLAGRQVRAETAPAQTRLAESPQPTDRLDPWP